MSCDKCDTKYSFDHMWELPLLIKIGFIESESRMKVINKIIWKLSSVSNNCVRQLYQVKHENIVYIENVHKQWAESL